MVLEFKRNVIIGLKKNQNEITTGDFFVLLLLYTESPKVHVQDSFV